MRLAAAILTGGRASRFGSDKAMAQWRGRPLVTHIAERLRPRVERLVTCGGEVRLVGVPHLADRPHHDLGPLGGLCAALTDARDHGIERVLSVGCDTPVLPDELLERLLSTPVPAIFATLPLIGVWPSESADTLAEWLLMDPRRSVRGWAERCGAAALPLAEAVPNVNTIADLRALGQS